MMEPPIERPLRSGETLAKAYLESAVSLLDLRDGNLPCPAADLGDDEEVLHLGRKRPAQILQLPAQFRKLRGTGIPRSDEAKTATPAPVSAQKPPRRLSFVIRWPMVLMIRQPPESVPRAITL